MTVKDFYSGVLLSLGGSSWGFYEYFKAASDFCRDVLPITGVISFVIYVVINWKSIKRIFTRKNKQP